MLVERRLKIREAIKDSWIIGERSMENLKLTVTVTNYNQKAYIEQAIDSILNQNIGYPYEILIGDDGSSDGSYELIKEKYGKYENIKIFRMPRDSSIKEFSNWRHSRLIWYLLKRARGEYISILDGDDYYWGTDGFNRKIEILDKEENKDCIACTSASLNDENGKIVNVVYPQICSKLSLQSVFFSKERYFYQIGTCVFRSSVLKFADFDFPELSGADQAILYFILYYGKLYFTPEYDFVYRRLPNSIWHKGNEEEHAIRIAIGFNIARLRYKKFYYRRLWRDRKSLLYVYKNKKDIPKKIDWEMWGGL